jgi:hypothetical protein
VQADDLRLLGIPRLRETIASLDPRHDRVRSFPAPLGEGLPKQSRLVGSAIVVRVLPRTFRSITDLLLARSMVLQSTPGAAEKEGRSVTSISIRR